MPKIICVGSTSKDIFFPTDEGVLFETPEDVMAQTKVAFELGGKFLVKDRFEAVGGVAANVATGLSRLGLEAHCYSKVGKDEIGAWIQKNLREDHVELDTLFVAEEVRSDLSAIVVITQTGDRLIFHNRDANEKLEIIPEKLERAEWFFVSALNGPWEKNLETLLSLAREKKISLALNPGQHNLKENPKLLLEALSHIELLALNKDEAIELLLQGGVEGEKKKLNSEIFLMQALHARGVPLIGLTDGRRGAWASDGTSFLHADIYESHGLVDTTGAGDAFGSGFFGAFLKGLPLERSLQYGIINAGSVVGYYGATAGLLKEETLKEHLSQVKVEKLSL